MLSPVLFLYFPLLHSFFYMLCSIRREYQAGALLRPWLFSMATLGIKCAGAEYSSCIIFVVYIAMVQSAKRVARRQLPVPSSNGSKD